MAKATVKKTVKSPAKKTVTKKAVATETTESGADVKSIPHSGGGFLVTEKSADGSYNQYISETDPNAE